jgi:integrase
VLWKFEGHDLWAHVNLTLASGVRRGELLAAQFGDVDLEGGSLKIERSLEETAAGLRFKSPNEARPTDDFASTERNCGAARAQA